MWGAICSFALKQLFLFQYIASFIWEICFKCWMMKSQVFSSVRIHWFFLASSQGNVDVYIKMSQISLLKNYWCKVCTIKPLRICWSRLMCFTFLFYFWLSIIQSGRQETWSLWLAKSNGIFPNCEIEKFLVVNFSRSSVWIILNSM